jgi:hypothetical protein
MPNKLAHDESVTFINRLLLPRFQQTILVLAATGATLGVLLDGLHSHFGATSYTHPIFAKTAWWVPLLFAGAYTSGIVRPLLDRRPLMSANKVALGMGLFVIAYALTVAPIDLSSRVALLIATFATGFHFCDPSRACLTISLIGGFTGPFVESLLIRAGTFVHHEAHIEGVPIWLPVLYMNAGVGLGTLGLWLVQKEREPTRRGSRYA